MKKNSIGLPVISAMAIAMGLGGCADENPWGNTSSQTGSINLTLTTDYEFDTAKPVFRSGEGETGKKVKLSEYTSVPSAEAFQIKLENTKGYSHEWRSLTAFNADESIKGLATGLYTITAYYGAMATTGEDRPYFEAKSSFTVLPNKTSEVELNAELKNSMVYIDYTADFLAYMSSFTTTLSTKGSTQIASNTYNKEHPLPEKTKAIFIEPKEVKVDVSFTTKETGKTASVNIGTFAALAKTLHRMTLDINHKNNGFATLSVTFDEKTGSETVDVDLTEQLFATEAPTITFTGSNSGTEVSSGATIDMSADNKMAFSVFVPGGLQTATLTVKPSNSDDNHAEVIDLMDITETEPASKNIKANGFNGKIEESGNIATLDITEYAKGLSSGDYSVKLDVTDKSNRTASFQLYANTEQVEAKLAKDGDNNLTRDIVYASGSTELILDYNGNDYQELTFKASGASGTLEDVTANYVKSEMLSTRGYENMRCHYNVTLPYSKKTKVNFEVYNKGGEKIADFEVPVAVPQYTISETIDAYAHYAYIKVIPDNKEDLDIIMDNITFQGMNGSKVTDEEDVILITGLSSNVNTGTTYTISSSLTGDNWISGPSFTTEKEEAIPNGDFKNGDSHTISNVQVGASWKYFGTWTHHTTITYSTPTSWSTINELTAWSGAGNKNTWFVIPSSYIDNGVGYLRTVGYNHNGTTPETKTYGLPINNSKEAPNSSQYDHSTIAGEIFLGFYSFNEKNEVKNYGAEFNSRPKSISFEYMYKHDYDTSDYGYAYISILDSKDSPLCTPIKLRLEASEKMINKTVNLDYKKFGAKAAKIRIEFKSSGKDKPQIHIPSGDELNQDEKANKDIPYEKCKAIAKGSELWIDNVTAHYATEPPAEASAVKRNTNKKTRR